MLFTCVCLCLRKIQTNPDRTEKENTPSFVDAITDNYTLLDLNLINEELEYSTTTMSSTHRDFAFIRCSVTLYGDTNFISNYAFGQSPSSGLGGAIFLSQSVLVFYGSGSTHNFSMNIASVGGAICSIASSISLECTTFQSNIAYKYGGGIYFQGAFLKDNDYNYLSPSVTLIGYNNVFNSNSACEIGGAIAFSFGLQIYLEKIIFAMNKCCFSGGAVFCSGVDDIKFVYCTFIKNIVNAENTNIMSYPMKLRYEESSTTFSNGGFVRELPSRFKARGGGAICFISDAKKNLGLPTTETTKEQRYLETNGCCFNKDSSTYTAVTFGNGAGHEILLEGYAKWKSYMDRMNGIDKNLIHFGFANQYVSRSLSSIWDGNASEWVIFDYQGAANSSEICYPTSITLNNSDPDLPDETTISYAEISNEGNDAATSSVPDPTSYTYVATPITRLPQATTQSASLYSIATRNIGTDTTFDFNNLFNPGSTGNGSPSTPEHYPGLTATPNLGFRTLVATPSRTAKETPYETIFSTAHSTPYETIFSTAHSTPVITHFSTVETTPSVSVIAERTVLQTPNSLLSSKAGKTYSSTNTLIVIEISSMTNLSAGETYWNGSNFTTAASDGEYTVYSVTLISSVILFNETDSAISINSDDGTTSKSTNLPLIIGIVAGIIGLLIIIGLIIFAVCRKKDENSSNSANEMQEETVMQLPDSTTTAITNDNPLWTTSVMGDTDDPFKNDFEEDTAQGFFGIAHEPIIRDLE